MANVHKGNLIASFIYGIFSVWIIVRSLSMPLTATDGLGYGFYPLLVGIFMLLLSIWWLLSALKIKGAQREDFIVSKDGALRLAYLVCIIFLMTVLLTYLGYFVSFGVFYVLVVFLIEKKKGKDAFLSLCFFTVIISMVYLIFAVWIDVPLPEGIWLQSQAAD